MALPLRVQVRIIVLKNLNVKFYEAINTFYARVNSVPIQDTFLMSNLIEHVIVLLPLDTLIF